MLVHGDGPVGEGDGVAEAGLPLHHLLAGVHDDLGALGAGVEEERAGDHGPGQTPATLDGQAVLGLVVTPVGRGRKGAAERVCRTGDRKKEGRLEWMYDIQ